MACRLRRVPTMRAGGGARCVCEQEQGCRGRAGRAARWVSVCGMLILVAPTALAVGSGVDQLDAHRLHHHLDVLARRLRRVIPASHGGRMVVEQCPFWAVHVPG